MDAEEPSPLQIAHALSEATDTINALLAMNLRLTEKKIEPVLTDGHSDAEIAAAEHGRTSRLQVRNEVLQDMVNSMSHPLSELARENEELKAAQRNSIPTQNFVQVNVGTLNTNTQPATEPSPTWAACIPERGSAVAEDDAGSDNASTTKTNEPERSDKANLPCPRNYFHNILKCHYKG
ncbi:hypothetical protein BCR34DRAFT_609766 [Clohesyomyces aquaticus]|uniref:Uncharacterized protein n=1 Tax=Clohesyomyces aquaticus TaxID=1231657 RepID=A0A1Y2AA01_9PLEO|nr:hypothetical protein BCR34DRAFT_609766 [Clohesyomyces aquaticus]